MYNPIMTIKVEEIDGEKYHYVVGFLIEKNDKYLLMNRKIYPYGYAAPCGHVDEGESIGQAINRELEEETGLGLENYHKIYDDVIAVNPCHYDNVYKHKTTVYEVTTFGKLKVDDKEFKSFGWFNKEEIAKLDLEPMWKVIFEKIGFLK
jgi:ADP-ribose pyrophosphatase YjhB (NUDIX family)